jgi:hypothetical protein
MPNRDVAAVVDLARNAQGAWIGSMTLPGSTSVDVPLADIAADGVTVRFIARLAGNPSFEGKLSDDAGSLSGMAANAQGEVPFELTRNGEAKVKIPAPSSPLAKEFAGAWEGTLEVGEKKLRLALRFSAAADGSALATLSSLDQGSQEVQVTTVTFTGKSVQLTVPAISGIYRGTLDASGEIAGEWTQGGKTLPLAFKRAAPAEKKTSAAAGKAGLLPNSTPANMTRVRESGPAVLIRLFLPVVYFRVNAT